MTVVVSQDGVICSPQEARIPVMDRGFLYGDSAFEVLRTYGGQPYAFRAHIDRLEGSCQRLGIPMPVERAVLSRELAEALQACPSSEQYIRIIVTRGTGPAGIHLHADLSPTRVIVVLPLKVHPPEMYAEGVTLATVRSARGVDGSPAAGAKASNYLANILALEQARKTGAHEALTLTAAGEVLEGATSNFFMVEAGAIVTPSLRMGILDGITRRTVLAAAATLKLSVNERLIFPSELYRAKEAFITSTLREVVPVVGIDGVCIGAGRPGDITSRIHAAFREKVRDTLESEKGWIDRSAFVG